MIKYNSFILADKDYYLARSKGVLGSILSKKELSQFDINSISKRPSQNILYNRSPILLIKKIIICLILLSA